MPIKLAIHDSTNGFSQRWIAYCENHKISYKIVNCYDNDILSQLSDCDGLMWRWSNDDYRDQQFARQLACSIENLGIKMFPDSNTCWHYDDKVGQKYLLESIGAPLIPTYVFYSQKDALTWANRTTYPKVFKLSAGAGSTNVWLVYNARQAENLIHKSFSVGFPYIGRTSELKQRIWILRRDKNIKAAVHFMKGVVRFVCPKANSNLLPRQKGYVYFQDFIPDNAYDDRILVIGNRALNARRYVRTNDFRASGSGMNKFEIELSNPEAIKLAFNLTKALKSQSVAFDIMYDQNNNPLVIEISYAFPTHGFDRCPGYWDDELVWHSEPTNPQYYMIEDFINSIVKSRFDK